MAELIYHVAVSLDNFIADQGMLEGDLIYFCFWVFYSFCSVLFC